MVLLTLLALVHCYGPTSRTHRRHPSRPTDRRPSPGKQTHWPLPPPPLFRNPVTDTNTGSHEEVGDVRVPNGVASFTEDCATTTLGEVQLSVGSAGLA